jgi:general nucleoside transport system permease protein
MNTAIADPVSTASPSGGIRAFTDRFGRGTKALVVVVALIGVLGGVRIATDTKDLTSSGTSGAALRVGMPILLAGLAALYAERCGVINIGVEGMMVLGTWFGAWGGWRFGPWAGVFIGVMGGMLGGLVHAVATVKFNVNHIVSGVAINILGPGITRFLSETVFEGVAGGGATQSPRVATLGRFTVPILAGGKVGGWRSPDVLGWLEHRGWFLISDAAGLGKGFVADISWLTLLILALVPFSAFVLWKTRFGLRLRAAGEHPGAADTLGVSVIRMRYLGTMISGALAGLAGAFIVIVQTGIYKEGQTQGRGFIGIAAMIFGNWRPAMTLVGSLLFGSADALQQRSESTVHALLAVIGVVLVVGALLSLWRRRRTRAVVMAVIAAGFLFWYNQSSTIPSAFLQSTGHLATLIVLIWSTQRLRPPAAEGVHFRKGET